MLNLTIKIRLHLQKSSHLVFSPKIAIFVLSCKEIRRRRRRNGQAGARPCKMTVGDAGTETENRCNSLIYIGLTFVRKHLYPHNPPRNRPDASSAIDLRRPGSLLRTPTARSARRNTPDRRVSRRSLSASRGRP